MQTYEKLDTETGESKMMTSLVAHYRASIMIKDKKSICAKNCTLQLTTNCESASI